MFNPKRFNLLLVLFFSFSFSWFLNSPSFAEGIKQLQPASTLTNMLRVNGGAGTNTGNNFGFLSTPLQKLYVHIKDFSTERIYFGFNPNTAGNIYIRIKDPSGAIVYGPVLLPQVAGPGFINNYSEAFNGPGQVAGGGYNALSFNPGMNGDFSVEFNLGSPTVGNSTIIDFDFYDITVANTSTLTAITGRLYAYLWAFTTTAAAKTLLKQPFMLTPLIM